MTVEGVVVGRKLGRRKRRRNGGVVIDGESGGAGENNMVWLKRSNGLDVTCFFFF